MSPKIDPPSEAAPAPGGAYEVLRQRLVTQAAQLRDQAAQLDGERRAVFGDSSLEVIGRLNVRTENNCVARDLVQVGDLLLFGYNVFIGLKKETRIEDVFALYRLNALDGSFEAEPVPIAGSFLEQPGFVQDFRELYTYYKHTRLLQLIRRETLLLAVFQLSERPDDIRVFRWDIGAGDREIRYRDNRGERDIVLPPAFDFSWKTTSRDDVVAGRHPHLNILDTVFVETINGDLTVKIENNTEDGLGIYREPVSDQTQSIDDASIEYAQVGSLILLRITPYKEPTARHLVYNTLTRQVQRLDAIANACVQLPEDHGIVFPGGCVLQNGDTRLFDQNMDGMRFRRMIRSPNGEDVLYVFYQPDAGAFALFVYNLILRQLRSPLLAHGYARYDDGRIVLFSAESEEPTRVHAMQVWRTPFCSDEFAASAPSQDGWIAKLGNAEIVRALSTLHALAREAESDQVSSARYARLVDEARRLFDHHHWIGQAAMQTLAGVLRELIATGEAVLGEFAKVEGLQRAAERSLAETRTRFEAVRAKSRPERFEKIEDFVAALAEVDALRGHVLNVREQRYVDVAACDAMRKTLDELSVALGSATFDYLASSDALAPLRAQVGSLEQAGLAATSAREGKTGIEACRSLAVELDVLSSVIANLQTDDAPRQTRIVGEVGEIYAALNQARARIGRHVESLGGEEATAQFAAQFQLFAQAVQHALGAANDPERCDAELSRVLVQLEEIESRFGEHERFTQALLDKREEVLEAFESHRQALVDARQRKAAHLHEAAARILDGLSRRTARISEADALQSFFVSDPLILKLRELVERLRALGDAVKADDIEARVKAARDQAIRAQRDAAELFEDGGDTIKLGPRHRFSVNRQDLDLTALPRGDTLCLHLIGTDFFEPIDDAELQALRPYWEHGFESESADLARAEYLAQRFLEAAEAGREGLSMAVLRSARLEPAGLEPLLRRFAEPRYREGYERGIHDHDAARIAAALLDLRASAGLLRHDPAARCWAALAWQSLHDTAEAKRWPDRARAAAALQRSTGSTRAIEKLVDDLNTSLHAWTTTQALQPDAARCRRAAVFLAEWLAQPHPRWVVSRDAAGLIEHARARLDGEHAWQALTQTCGQTEHPLAERLALAEHGFEAVLDEGDRRRFYVPEAAALLVQGQDSVPKAEAVDLAIEVGSLLSQHARIVEGRMQLAVDAFTLRWQAHTEQFLPQLQRMHALRHAFLQGARRRMRLAEFKPRPLTSFVRNRLINEVYLGVVADNLAKQIGAAGATKRSDLMGLLMLISPPGYGKTTLMEYVADRLGLVFMKINGPALGHEVRALDPARAPDATSRQELEKLNLALEMGNNVMLYVDDIQHTHPEFLQKFISLCDGSRRIEGVWRGETRTYDLRGKKFCVVMAGNPYTESGEVFRIPDMLANRADVYNLGEVVGGREDLFLLSYLENALTSNPALAPLATRPMADVYALIERAQGKPVSLEALSHGYSQAEIDEIVSTFERLISARDVVYRVNQQYIASAAQDDAYRSEPAFKLQGSYRNMAKLAEKIRGVMNAAELNRLIDDHYLGEAQLLTTGAEENLLKLAELRGCLDEERAARWAEIKRTYARNRSLGGSETDTGTRLVAQLGHLVESVRDLRSTQSTDVPTPADEPAWWPQLRELLERMASEQTLARTFSRDSATDSAMWLGGLRNALELGFRPLVDGMKLRSDQHAELNKLIKALIAEQRRGKAKPAD